MRTMGFDSNHSIWFLWILALGVVMLCHDQHKMVAVAEECEQDMRGFRIECLYYMAKDVAPIRDPNDRCCHVIQTANIPCWCNHINEKLLYPPWMSFEDLLDWNKVMHCMNFCQRPLPPGSKCGKFTVPPK